MRNKLRTATAWLSRLIDEPSEAASILAVVGIVFAIGGYVFLHGRGSLRTLANDFYANAATELISIAITVLIIDRLYAKRSANEEKQRIIRQMGSHSNEFALEAVRLCRERGWLEDGSLVNAYLRKANLQGAILENADLRGAVLSLANLQGAELMNASLQDAMLWGANFQDATLEDPASGWLFPYKDTNFEGAAYDKRTIWPDGFTLSHKGLKNIDMMSEDEREKWLQRWEKRRSEWMKSNLR